MINSLFCIADKFGSWIGRGLSHVKPFYQGRLNRRQFVFVLVLGASILLAVGGHLPKEVCEFDTNIKCFFLNLALEPFILIFFFTLNKRWHDLGFGGFKNILLICISPIPVVFLGLIFMPGKKADNQYGKIPAGFNLIRLIYTSSKPEA